MTSVSTTATLLTIGKGLLRELKAAASAPAGRPDGWELLGTYRVLSGPVDGIYRVAIPADDPIRLRHGDTDIVVPFAEMDTDFGSIPGWCRTVAASLHLSALHLAPDAYPKSTIGHDAFYAAARCIVVRDRHALEIPITRPAADAWLMLALRCEGASRADVFAYGAAVKRHGGAAWDEHRRNPPNFPPLFEIQPSTTNETETENENQGNYG